MNNYDDSDQETAGGFDWRAIALKLVHGWRLILLSGAIAVLIAIYTLHHATYIYTARMRVMPPQGSSESSGASGLSGALGGFAALANISLPGNSNASQFRLYVDSLKSHDLADELARNRDVMRRLFSEDWDESAGAWREPPRGSLYGIKVGIRKLLGLAPLQPWHAPDGSNMQMFLNDKLTVTENIQKPYLVAVTLSYSDRDFAIRFLDLIRKTADDRLRRMALSRTRDYVNYLSEKLQTTTVAEHRLAIAQALSEQEKYAMVASSGAPFAADVFERPWAPMLADSPQPGHTLVIFLLMGLAIGGALAYLLASYGTAFYGWMDRRAWWRNAPGILRRIVRPDA